MDNGYKQYNFKKKRESNRKQQQKFNRIVIILTVVIIAVMSIFLIIFAANSTDTLNDTDDTAAETINSVTSNQNVITQNVSDSVSDTETSDTETEVSETTAETTTVETTTEEETTLEETTEETLTTDVVINNNSTTISSNGSTIEVSNGVSYAVVNGQKILLANKSYSLPSTYNPGGLTSETNAAFNRLASAASKAGYSLWIASGFRSYDYQITVYNKWVNRYGKAQADRISARPGYSEHQSGLAIDVNDLNESFGETATGKWLAAHCHEYGFIIRYPKGKESITGYSYEPWHIRYIGDLATDIYNSGLTLEEYLGINSEYAN